MIQRIQTIWLLFASICAFAGLKVGFYSGNIMPNSIDAPLANYYLEINGMYSIISNVLTICIAVLSFVSIFLFSNRKVQIKFCMTTLLLELSLIYYYWITTKLFKEGSFSIGSSLQLLIIIFLLLAVKGIAKDKKIVAENDRLR